VNDEPSPAFRPTEPQPDQGRYHALFEAIDEGFCIIEFLDGPHGPLSDYIHVEANAAYAKHAGIENVVGQKVREMVPDEADGWVELYGGVLSTGKPIRFERELVATARYLELSAFRIEPPELRQVAVLFRDMTARRRTEKALRESEARYRGLINASNQVLYRHNADWTQMQQLSGGGFLEDTDAPDPDWFAKYIHPDDQGFVWEKIQEAIRNKSVFELEHRVFREDGTIGWTSSRSIPVLDENGEIVEWFGAASDVSMRHEAEDALRESEERFRKLADDSPIMVWVTDKDAQCTYLSRHWYEFTGQRKEEALGLGWLEAVHPDDRGWSGERFLSANEKQEPFQFEYRLRNRDGEYRWAIDAASPRFGSDGEFLGYVGSVVDIHDRKQLEDTLSSRVAEEIEARLEAEDALRQAQKMETLGQLTGGIAHDFNNLLQIISGNLDIVRRNLPPESARLNRSVENAMKGSERAAVLTQRLLAFSRRQPLAPKVIDANKLVSGMSELLHRTLGENYAIETVLGSGLWKIEADPNQLESALLNLAVNARDAMNDGGRLTIETTNAHIDQGYADLHSGVFPGQYVLICVSDTGDGMDVETVERAFEPFFTTKAVGKGTGLGLSMVYGFVKQSGGHVKIYSEAEQGTTVKIYLPRYRGSELEDIGERVDQSVPEGDADATILVCEDDADVRTLSATCLRELGYRVIEAADGEAALRIIAGGENRIDLLFTDVVLPGMTGAVLAKQAKELIPALKVLFTTGYARNAIVHHGRLDAGVELISKPFTYADLATRIRDLLDARDTD
jgi:PAS domain S-box-containing protein